MALRVRLPQLNPAPPIPAKPSKTWFKVSGQWNRSRVFIKQSGKWVEVRSFLKINGIWQ